MIISTSGGVMPFGIAKDKDTLVCHSGFGDIVAVAKIVPGCPEPGALYVYQVEPGEPGRKVDAPEGEPTLAMVFETLASLDVFLSEANLLREHMAKAPAAAAGPAPQDEGDEGREPTLADLDRIRADLARERTRRLSLDKAWGKLMLAWEKQRERAERAEAERDAYLRMLTPANFGGMWCAATGRMDPFVTSWQAMEVDGPWHNRSDAVESVRKAAGLDAAPAGEEGGGA